jgi:hypothetical protein
MRGISLKAPIYHLAPLAGRGRIALAIRVRGSLSKRGRNRFKNAGHIAKDIVVPKSQDAIIVISKPFVANGIARIIRMLSSVDFDYQTAFAANEIDDVGTDRILPYELVPVQPARPQPGPKRGFGVRRDLPQTPGASRFYFVGRPHAATPPHPDCFAIRPLPASGARLAHRIIP